MAASDLEILRNVVVSVDSCNVQIETDPRVFMEAIELVPDTHFLTKRYGDSLIINQTDEERYDGNIPIVRLNLPVGSLLAMLSVRVVKGEVTINGESPVIDQPYGLEIDDFSIAITEAGNITTNYVQTNNVARLYPNAGEVRVRDSTATIWLIPREADRITDDAGVHGDIAYIPFL